MSALWIVSLVSLCATWMNVRKMSFCFVLWILTNTTWAIVDALAGYWPRFVLDVAYVALAIEGFRKWTRTAWS